MPYGHMISLPVGTRDIRSHASWPLGLLVSLPLGIRDIRSHASWPLGLVVSLPVGIKDFRSHASWPLGLLVCWRLFSLLLCLICSCLKLSSYHGLTASWTLGYCLGLYIALMVAETHVLTDLWTYAFLFSCSLTS
ncbi:hypothetical protein PoB_004995400 [Plakobranchus ocellatus]|uniref:Uncharacterized protein n=1 Tax=Plakobranchus ocellatus TaxID=259542 RepID=A0AAV4BTD0_9GAST|nr:hypothetical protein PoB_004995400 [Plakobranchus ocellatus]